MKLIIIGVKNKINTSIISKVIELSNISIINEIVTIDDLEVNKPIQEFAKIYDIPIKIFKTDWNSFDDPNVQIKNNRFGSYNANAINYRNKQMFDYVFPHGLLIAIWDGQCKDVKKFMIQAHEYPIDYLVYNFLKDHIY